MNSEDICTRLEAEHGKDSAQLQVIFSEKTKLIVEAPAGSGKTKTLVSKIAYLLATDKVPKNKKILALTFGVNAAYKIKKDVCEKLPQINDNFISNPSILNKKITVTNFHGFAKHVLSLYGYLLNTNLKNINNFTAIDDSRVENLKSLEIGITEEEAHWITDFSQCIKDCKINHNSHRDAFLYYAQLLYDKLIPRNYITYNGYLILLYELFDCNEKLKNFYSKLYTTLIIDEFQDTNVLSWDIIQQLVINDTNLFLFGDSLQRIYGFIGAIDNLMDSASQQYKMDVIKLSINYRFKNNSQMLSLDHNIRECAEKYELAVIENLAVVNLALYSDSCRENKGIIEYIKFMQARGEEKIAILTRSNSNEVKSILQAFEDDGIEYFYALFSDEDKNYIDFHDNAVKSFLKYLGNNQYRRLSIKLIQRWISVYESEVGELNVLEKSLFKLLRVFIANLFDEYRFLSDDEKIQFIIDVLGTHSLKQSMEHIEEKVIISTVHGAKGLEWDNVILIGMTDYSFPGYYGLCNYCYKYKGRTDGNCRLDLKQLKYDLLVNKKFIEELSVFYVAITRARKTLLLVSNKERFVASRGQYVAAYKSCFLSLPGIKLNILNDYLAKEEI